MRRVKILRVCNSLLMDLFKSGRQGENLVKYYSNLPKDVKVISCQPNFERNTTDYLISSGTFEIVEEGFFPPEFEYESIKVNKWRLW